MKQKKRYVVREGLKVGIFDTWEETLPLVSGIKGSKYKSFPTLHVAEVALKEGRESYYHTTKNRNKKELPFVKKSIAVDAACSSASGVMEYQGIDLVSEQVIFSSKFSHGTNNIGEFLAIVHGLAWLEKEKKTDYALYSDSKIALQRVKDGRCKTHFDFGVNDPLLAFIKRAEMWLTEHLYTTQLLKWQTFEWGEIPADFGRK